MSVGAALLTGIGGALGGTLVFEYGFNVETAGDGPAWHRSETDILAGHMSRADDQIDVTDGSVERAGEEPAHR